MAHPQPAFDFLLSLPRETEPHESVFADWYAQGDIDATIDDRIEDYPEVWEFLELPETLQSLSTDDIICYQRFSGSINLNAVAIGLGLEDTVYEPVTFPGLEYNPSEYGATAYLFFHEVMFAVGENEQAARGTIEVVIDRLGDLGLSDTFTREDEPLQKPVTEFIDDSNPR